MFHLGQRWVITFSRGHIRDQDCYRVCSLPFNLFRDSFKLHNVDPPLQVGGRLVMNNENKIIKYTIINHK